MIFQKRNNEEGIRRKIKSSNKIAVLGAAQSVGVTHFCLLLAQYAAMHLGESTAVLECNHHKDFLKIREYTCQKEDMPFTYKEVDFYECNGVDEMMSLEDQGYRQIILDCGSSMIRMESYLNVCDQRILLGGHSPWMKQCMKLKQEMLEPSQWMFLFNLSPEGIPYCPIEQTPPKEAKNIFDTVLRRYRT